MYLLIQTTFCLHQFFSPRKKPVLISQSILKERTCVNFIFFWKNSYLEEFKFTLRSIVFHTDVTLTSKRSIFYISKRSILSLHNLEIAFCTQACIGETGPTGASKFVSVLSLVEKRTRNVRHGAGGDGVRSTMHERISERSVVRLGV